MRCTLMVVSTLYFRFIFGVLLTLKSVVIKDEPQSETEPSKRKSAVDVRSADESLIDGTGTKKEPKTPRLRKALNLKSPQLWKQTKEDGEEWDRIKQAEELVKSQLTDPSILFRPQGRDPMDGLAATNPNSALSYIFQFPPVLPLLEVARETRDGKLKAKTVVIDEEKIPETKLKLPTGRKSEAQEIKPPLFLSPTMRTPSERYPPGKVGKLVVHESGATYLHWGTGPTASVLELKNGHALGFRMDLVMAEQGFADQEAAVGDQDVIKDEMEPEPRTDPRTLPLKGEADDVLPAGERMDLDEENTDGKKGADGNKAGQRETIAKEEDGLDDDSFEEVILGGAPQTLRRGGACSLGPIVGRFTLMPDWERLLGSL